MMESSAAAGMATPTTAKTPFSLQKGYKIEQIITLHSATSIPYKKSTQMDDMTRRKKARKIKQNDLRGGDRLWWREG